MTSVPELRARKARGAFFTPPPIAKFLAEWAIADRADARVLDPTCGDGVFLRAAANELRRLGAECRSERQLVGVDIDGPSLADAERRLAELDATARLLQQSFFEVAPPGDLFPTLPAFDAVVGNPPFIRYQNHVGEARTSSRAAALRQGVRLSGLASSWAAMLVHSAAFLAPEGRLAMVLPAELLTVGYAEPIREWLRQRFSAVKLVVFESLQFDGALENVVLLLAHGSGGCDAFSLYYVDDAGDLERVRFEEFAVAPPAGGKWTDLLLRIDQRQLFRAVADRHFAPLGDYGAPELGTVTGANSFFALNEGTRLRFGLEEGRHVVRISPPGTKHFSGLSFSKADWEALRRVGAQVWLLQPELDAEHDPSLRAYLRMGEEQGVPDAYKCQVRSPWWKPPGSAPPDLFFTYMSHRFPRLIRNSARASFLNSMHGVRLKANVPTVAREALPLLCFNSVTMLGAEVFGRAYGGGVLKMEPREAAVLPVPSAENLIRAWSLLKPEVPRLNRQLRQGLWTNVLARVDDALLRGSMELHQSEVDALHGAARTLRSRRLRQPE